MITTEKLIDKLELMPLLSGLSRMEIDQLLQRLPYRMRRISAGTSVAYAGKKLDDNIFLVEGRVLMTLRKDKSDNDVVVDVIDKPSLLAPAAVFAATNGHDVNIKSETECLLIYANGEGCAQALHDDMRLMLNFLRMQSERITFLTDRVHEFTLLTLRDRVVHYMRRHSQPVKNLDLFARRLGVTRPSLSRVISELRAAQIIARTSEGLVLLPRKN